MKASSSSMLRTSITEKCTSDGITILVSSRLARNQGGKQANTIDSRKEA